MLVAHVTGLGAPCPSGWYLAPFLFLVKSISRAGGLVDKSVAGCDP